MIFLRICDHQAIRRLSMDLKNKAPFMLADLNYKA